MKFYKVTDYASCIKKYFPMDEELISTYHIIAGSTAEECCDRTIKDLDKMPLLEFFEFENEVGFFGIEGKGFLTTLFINPKYRTKEYMSQIWDTMLSTLDDTFMTAFYSKNTRAVEFFKKNGAKIIAQGVYENNPVTVLEYRR